jgi:hypothetical protein
MRFVRLWTVMLCTSGASASTFELSGTIVAESGLGLSGAALTLVHESTGLVRATTSNDAGRYAFPGMPPGAYSLEVALAGFATSRFAGLRYFAETKPIFNVTLRLRAVQESVTFTGEAPLINVSQSQVGLSVEERQLHELPLTRNDYLELAPIEGGVHEILESTPGAAIYGAPRQTINGANAHYSTYHLDGFGNTRDQHGVVHIDVDVDAVEEFRVISGQFSAEYGQSLAGIVSATTRSGGNDFHGSVFTYIRPGDWDADDPLTGASTALDRQELGFTFSGPIVENRTQFFTSYSYRNQNADVVVTAPFEDGRFRGVFTLPSTRHRLLVKLTHLLTPRHQLSVKGAFSELDSVEGAGGFDIFDNRQNTINDDGTIVATLASDLGGASNELRVGRMSERFSTSGQPPPLGPVEIHPTLGNIGNPTRLQRSDESHFTVSDTIALPAGNHRIKTGFTFLRVGSTSELERYTDPVIFFPAPRTEGPRLVWEALTESDSETVLDRSESHLQLFVQDDWQITPLVTLNLGLRWEKETSVPDDNNVAPRLGFHWDATGDGRSSVRGGYGIFYGFVFSFVDSLERLYGPSGRRVAALTGDDVDDAHAATSVPTNFFVDALEWAPDQRKAPMAQHVTFGVEREILPTITAALDVTYVRGESLVLPVDLNAPAFFDYTAGGIRSGSAADATRPLGAPGAPIPAGTVSELPEGYPFGGYRDLYLMSSRGTSRFWGVRFNVTKRYTSDLLIQAVYNWSRTENDGDDFRITESLPLDPARASLEWGRSATDIPHAFVLNGVWDAPFGIRLAGLFRARSGRPVDPRVDADLDGDRKLRERAAPSGAILERNSFRVGSTATLDLSIAKEWELGEARRAAVAVDVFNVTHRLNPLQFLHSYGASAEPLPTFLDIVHAGPPRQVQLSVRFTF